MEKRNVIVLLRLLVVGYIFHPSHNLFSTIEEIKEQDIEENNFIAEKTNAKDFQNKKSWFSHSIDFLSHHDFIADFKKDCFTYDKNADCYTIINTQLDSSYWRVFIQQLFISQMDRLAQSEGIENLRKKFISFLIDYKGEIRSNLIDIFDAYLKKTQENSK